jgi:hypothetical protein
MFCSAKCALRADAKNVTAVTYVTVDCDAATSLEAPQKGHI